MLRRALHAIILVAFQRTMNGEVSPEEKSSVFSRSAYFTTMNDNRLHGYVIERFQSASLLFCNQMCIRRAWCTSTNFKAPSHRGKMGTCGLNKHSYSSVDERATLHQEDGVTFSLILKPSCHGNPCLNNGICVQDTVQLSFHCVCKAGFAGPRCQACTFDFEDGIDGWEKTGTAFNNQPTYGDNPTARKRGQPAKQQGDWWIGGFEDRPSKAASPGRVQGDQPRGTLISPSFKINGPNITFLIGGGCKVNSARAELVISNQVVRNKTGNCNETMRLKSWDVQSFIGKRARVRLVDNSSGEWGHINFDFLGGDISCEEDKT